jgi:hypothetical protein
VRDPIFDYAPVSEPWDRRDTVGAVILVLIVGLAGLALWALLG